MTRKHERTRPPLSVTRDSDGGLTIHDPASGIVLSVISSHPYASGPKSLTVEAYAYRGGDILASDITPPPLGEPWTAVPLRIARHPTYTFTAPNESAERLENDR